MPVCVVAANACTTAGLPKSSHPISCHDNRLLSDYRSIYLLSAILQSFEETAKWAAAVERHENRSSKRNPKESTNQIDSNREKNRMNATNRTTDPVSIYMLVFFCFQFFVINRLKQQATTLYQPCPWRTRRRRRPASASTTEWVNHPVRHYLQSIYRQQLFAAFEMQQPKEVFELLYRFESTFIDQPATAQPPTVNTLPAAPVVQLHLVAVF